jgi:hypothetical protein
VGRRRSVRREIVVRGLRRRRREVGGGSRRGRRERREELLFFLNESAQSKPLFLAHSHPSRERVGTGRSTGGGRTRRLGRCENRRSGRRAIVDDGGSGEDAAVVDASGRGRRGRVVDIGRVERGLGSGCVVGEGHNRRRVEVEGRVDGEEGLPVCRRRTGSVPVLRV